MKQMKVLGLTVMLMATAALCFAGTTRLPTIYVSMSESQFRSEIAAANGQIGSILSQVRTMGVSAGIELISSNTARIWASGGGITVEQLVVNTGGGVLGGDKGTAPRLGLVTASRDRFRQNIFTPAKPKSQQKEPAAAEGEGAAPARREVKFGPGADLLYTTWDTGVKGNTIGINPSVTFGDKHEAKITVPICFVSPDDGDSMFGIGVDGAYKYSLRKKGWGLTGGAHLYMEGLIIDSEDVESAFVVGVGPFVGANVRFTDALILSGGVLVELTKLSDDDAETDTDAEDAVVEVIPGLNLGWNITDVWVLNGYVVGYQNLDSDVDESFYADVGAEAGWSRGTWGLSGGVKTSTGMEDVSATTVYVGSSWQF